MRKLLKSLLFVALVAWMCFCTSLVSDKLVLQNELIRLHVVGASNSDEDQAVKLQVRDAILAWVKENMGHITDAEVAREFLLEHLEALEAAANGVLNQAGFADKAIVTLKEEAFPIREYDTFRLPSGVYQSLRVEIGPAQGRNWWCVVFPSLCLSAAGEELEEAAQTGGFPEALTKALEGEKGYELRFFILDVLGNLENFFHQA